MFPGALGVAAGGWLAGVMYDEFGFYAPAFAAGIGFNLLNMAAIVPLVRRERVLPAGQVEDGGPHEVLRRASR